MGRFEEIRSYGCYRHAGRPGVGLCTKCSVVVCNDCAGSVAGRIYCPDHEPVRKETAARPTHPAARQKLRPALLIPVLLVVALAALALWAAPVLTSDIFGFYARSLTGLELEQIGEAVESFRADVGRYPTDEEGLGVLREEPPDVEGWLGPYLADDLYVEDSVVDMSGGPIVYSRMDDSYRLEAAGPDGKPGTEDDIVYNGRGGVEQPRGLTL